MIATSSVRIFRIFSLLSLKVFFFKVKEEKLKSPISRKSHGDITKATNLLQGRKLVSTQSPTRMTRIRNLQEFFQHLNTGNKLKFLTHLWFQFIKRRQRESFKYLRNQIFSMTLKMSVWRLNIFEKYGIEKKHNEPLNN